jgi:hypothetical protein
MRILAIEGTAGQRLVHICEPVSANKIGIFGNSAQKTGVGGAAFALLAGSDDPLPEQASIGRSKMKLADQGGFTKPMKAGPFIGIIGDRPPVAIEADHIAPSGAGLDGLAGLPSETAAKIEMVWIVAVQGFGYGAEISVRKLSAKNT